MAKRKIIRTQHAPQPVGPYSQGIQAGELIFTAGQIPLDPVTGRLVEGDMSAQTRRTLENVRAVLEAAGGSLKDVLRVTVYLTDLKDAPAVNEVFQEVFSKEPPARIMVQAAALPLGARLEIEAVGMAHKAKASSPRRAR